MNFLSFMVIEVFYKFRRTITHTRKEAGEVFLDMQDSAISKDSSQKGDDFHILWLGIEINKLQRVRLNKTGMAVFVIQLFEHILNFCGSFTHEGLLSGFIRLLVFVEVVPLGIFKPGLRLSYKINDVLQ